MTPSTPIPAPASAELPADLAAGLRRLKLARIRALAPELLATAKVQRWTPERGPAQLVAAEMEAGLQRRQPAQGRRLPGPQESRGVRRRRVLPTAFG